MVFNDYTKRWSLFYHEKGYWPHCIVLFIARVRGLGETGVFELIHVRNYWISRENGLNGRNGMERAELDEKNNQFIHCKMERNGMETGSFFWMSTVHITVSDLYAILCRHLMMLQLK